jgi:hypothetical protein
MKKRIGFVSNSSSSSFVICKKFMTKEQQTKFRNKLGEINDQYETYISEYPNYFIGPVSDHEEKLRNLISELKLNEFCVFDK